MQMRFYAIGLDRRAAAYKGARTRVAGAQNRALRRIGQLMVPIVKSHTPTGASKKLRNTTTASITGGARAQRLEIRQAARSRGGYFYGRAVRGGTRPHFPPYRELIPWVRVKLGVRGKEAERRAYLLARKIARRGTKANPYHERALRQGRAAIQAIVSQEGVNLIASLNR